MKPHITAALLALLAACAQQPPASPPLAGADRSLQAAITYHRSQALNDGQAGRLAEAAAHWQILGLLAPDDREAQAGLAATRKAIDEAVARGLQTASEAQRNRNPARSQSALLGVLALKPEHAEAQRQLREIERQRIVAIQAERTAHSRLASASAGLGRNPDKAAEVGRLYDFEQAVSGLKAGDTDNTAARRYLADNPKDSAGRRYLAEQTYQRASQLEAQGRGEQALPLFEQAIQLQEPTPPAWQSHLQALRHSLARDYLAKGQRAFTSDLAQAIRYWETSLRYDPGLGEAAKRLKEARRMQEQLKRIEGAPVR